MIKDKVLTIEFQPQIRILLCVKIILADSVFDLVKEALKLGLNYKNDEEIKNLPQFKSHRNLRICGKKKIK